MGNIRLGFFKAIIGAVLLFPIIPDIAYSDVTCNRLFAPPVPGRKLTEKTKLKIVNWNLLNFKIDITSLERGVLPYKRSDVSRPHNYSPKSIEELNAYEKILRHLNADIYIFQEAFGGSLKYFAKHYLNDQYEVILESHKKESELQIAFLVRKNLDIQFEVQSYEHLKWKNNLVYPPKEMQVFHKDLPALYLRQNDGSQTRPSDDPHLIIFGTHFKAMSDSEGDPRSLKQRTMQMQTAARVIHSVNQRYNYQVPIMLAGDFNTSLKNAPEVEPLKFFLKDSLQLKGKNQSLEATYTYETRNHVHKSRIDGQFINDALKAKLVESSVEHFPFDPSDHSPVISYYDMTR